MWLRKSWAGIRQSLERRRLERQRLKRQRHEGLRLARLGLDAARRWVATRMRPPATERARTGRRGERIAARELQRRGYRVLIRNWRTRVGEVDLVARDGPMIVLVEVRSSTRLGHAALLQRIDGRKRRQLARLLAYARRIRLGNGAALRVDAVFVDLRDPAPVVFVRRNVLSPALGR